jgi:hypothetical protein
MNPQEPPGEKFWRITCAILMSLVFLFGFIERKDQSPKLVPMALRNNISESFRSYRIFSLGKIACHFDTLWFYRLLLLQKKES